jgi:hypothetical protein
MGGDWAIKSPPVVWGGGGWLHGMGPPLVMGGGMREGVRVGMPWVITARTAGLVSAGTPM